MHAFVFVLEK